MGGRLQSRRVLVTHADRYLGPPVVELFRAEGAEVVDVLVANFAGPHRKMPVTEMLRELADYTDEMLADDAVRESFEAQIPAGRLGSGAEAAGLALALATGASGFLAGQIIPISGGWAT